MTGQYSTSKVLLLTEDIEAPRLKKRENQLSQNPSYFVGYCKVVK